MFKRLLQKIDPVIDYTGQATSEKCLYLIFILGYTAAYILGIILGDLKYTLYVAVLTVATAFVFVLPSWSCYRKNHAKFVEIVKEKNDLIILIYKITFFLFFLKFSKHIF
ncbi:hypothetical protein GVAV_000720 [Gurleya vavrai]